VGEALAALKEMEGWSGEEERLEPGEELGQEARSRPCGPFRLEDFACHSLTAGFDDGLVASLPEVLPSGAFRLEVGARLEPERFTRISVVFGAGGELQAWERRRYHPADVR
jgi:hypothetical protein